jgi:hypothetical protein
VVTSALSRVEAVAYGGVSPSMLGLMVKDSRIPGPKPINASIILGRQRLDELFEQWPDRANQNLRDGGQMSLLSFVDRLR